MCVKVKIERENMNFRTKNVEALIYRMKDEYS